MLRGMLRGAREVITAAAVTPTSAVGRVRGVAVAPLSALVAVATSAASTITVFLTAIASSAV